MKFERFERNIHFVWNCCSECGEFVCLTLIYKTDNTFHDCWPSDTDLSILMRTQYGLSLLINNLQNQTHKAWVKMGKRDISVGVMNGPLKFLTACKILPLLDLLAKFKRVLACSCSPNFCVGRKLAKQVFYFCSCSQKNRSARHARKDHSSPLSVSPKTKKEKRKKK